MNSGAPKGTSWAEMRSSPYPYPLPSYACLKASVSQAVSQSVEKSVNIFFKIT